MAVVPGTQLRVPVHPLGGCKCGVPPCCPEVPAMPLPRLESSLSVFAASAPASPLKGTPSPHGLGAQGLGATAGDGGHARTASALDPTKRPQQGTQGLPGCNSRRHHINTLVNQHAGHAASFADFKYTCCLFYWCCPRKYSVM